MLGTEKALFIAGCIHSERTFFGYMTILAKYGAVIATVWTSDRSVRISQIKFGVAYLGLSAMNLNSAAMAATPITELWNAILLWRTSAKSSRSQSSVFPVL